MAQKILRQYLDQVPVSIEDNSPTSPEYFGFEEDTLDDFFRLGINKIASQPNTQNLKPNSEILFEAIDAEGYALPFTTENETNSANKVILNLKVSKDTPIYDLELYFIGTLNDGSKVRWSRTFTVDREGVKSFGSPSGSLIMGSFFTGRAVGEGLELRGGENPILRSAGYMGFNAATASLGPSGFMLYSGSALGTTDRYEGVGFEIAASGSNRFLKMRSAFTIPAGGGLAATTNPVFDIGADNITATTASVKYLMIDKNMIPQSDPVVAGAIFVDPATGTLKISGFS